MQAWKVAGSLGLAVAFGAASASATPVTYNFTGGQVTVAAFVGNSATPIGGPVVLSLTGISVTVDEMALTLNAVNFSVGTSGNLTLSPDYNGYDTVNLDFANVSGFGGTLVSVDIGPPAEYSFLIGGVTVSGQLDASGPFPAPPITDQLFSIPNVTGSGTIFIDGSQLFLDGITLGAIDPDGPNFGVDPLVIKGDFIFIGEVPEPGTALLLGFGLAGLARARRRARA
jgi:hypothetical protein